MQVRGSQVSMGAEGGSNALSTDVKTRMQSPELQRLCSHVMRGVLREGRGLF